MAEWDEIKRLAADFQRTQTSDTLQKISERNCIDIVKKLTDLNLIDIIYTCDGKEFITPAHLCKEIEDEIYVNGGRMHLHDLAANLNVDYQHVESKARELSRDRPDEYSLILGQVIHSTYKNTLGKQINDCMLTVGQLSIADFAKSLDLPTEFLQDIIKEILPKVMSDFIVSQDGRTYYSADVMDRYRSIVAGTLSAILKPTSIASIMKRLDMPERIFMPIVESLIKEGRIDASIENRLYTPSLYAREQNDWINRFYSSNSYLEYAVLSRMGIKQPKAFLKKTFPDCVQLTTCAIGRDLVSQVESLIEDTIASNGWIDVSSILPTSIEKQDITQLLQDILRKNKHFSSSSLLLSDVNICSLGYLATCRANLTTFMPSKAQDDLKQGKLVNHFLGGKLKESSKPQETPKIPEPSSAENLPGLEQSDQPDKEQSNLPHTAEPEHKASGKANKKERKDKKVKPNLDDAEHSGDDQENKTSKSRKSGGGTQGREIKQKAVKKKYIPGNKANQNKNDLSDDESAPKKVARSNKGRAAKRAISPERHCHPSRNKDSQRTVSSSEETVPLIFMQTDELIEKLRFESRDVGDTSDEFLESIANLIKQDLDSAYESVARQTLDEYLKTQSSENDPDSTEIDLVQ